MTPQQRRNDIAVAQGFANYWAKRQYLREHPEAAAALDGRRLRIPAPKPQRETPPQLSGAA